ncbi:rhodanese-like domain-containing protein [Edaphobacillus lindanitolerans]|uniref:Rhodanese-related sulfurtransferase n=1 Tax=Edaphobacillus lindanitolerans TaxID=550447 RepID=A0A1U7PRE5_9BACI|nr:rhodanese-like domain-containing protein [Edaphobacillus lindanitolerans]SIT88000.1 Rhodanese-related sulfurtransferase [Edaphobacillus lindanitolerans]
MKEISTHELDQRLQAGEEFAMIDVREPEEVAAGMIAGAVHIPLMELPERFGELDRNREYVLICRSGGRSKMAAEFLEGQGFETVNMTGGMLEWPGETIA